MKDYAVLYFRNLLTQATPDANYHKMYPKADGWYWMGEDGEEHRLSSIVVIDADDLEYPGTDKIQFGNSFTVTEVGDTLQVDLDYSDGEAGTLMHGNESHTEEYITEADLITYNTTNVTPLLHTQNTDTRLDLGGANEVTAAQLRALVDANFNVAPRGLVRTSDAETNAAAGTEYYIADCELNNVDFILPEGDTVEDIPFTFRHACGLYAMTVYRSELDEVVYGCDVFEGLTTDTEGSWFEMVFSGGYWHVTKDNGVIEGAFEPSDIDS